MPVGEGCDADGEVAEPLDEADELVCVVEALGVRHPGLAESALRVTAEGEDVADARRRIRCPTTWRSSVTECPTQVRCAIGVKRGLLEHPLGEADRAVPGAAAGAVGDRDEARRHLLQATDRVPELLCGSVVLGREELEAEGRRRRLDHRDEDDRVKRSARVIEDAVPCAMPPR